MKNDIEKQRFFCSARRWFSFLIGICVLGLSAYPIDMVAAEEFEVVEELQQISRVTGTVTDSEGEPVIGASVMVKGTSTGTVTDLDGRYSIAVKSGQTIEFSFVGMKKVSVKVADKKTINVTMHDDAVALDEVVAIGYGTMKRSDLTGAVVSVSSEAIEQMNPTSIDQVLQGRAAGVQMTQNSGIPGGGSSIQIRGLNSINSTNEPIYVIDGVTISGDTGTQTDNALSSINPSDIESMEILKDASATAIYGAQGANGVIIITTKSGKEGKAKINVEAQYGIQYLPREIEVADLREFAYHSNDIYDALGYGKSSLFADPSTLGKGTNWQQAIFRPASMQNYNFNMSGGSKGTTYKLSGNYLTQDGIASGSDFDRITLTAGMDSQVRKWLKIGGRTTLSRTTQTVTIADWNLINSAVRQKPNIPVTNLDGSYAAPEEQDNDLSNPLAVSRLSDKNNRKLSVRANVYATVAPVKWFNFKTEFSASINSDETHSFVPTYWFNAWSQNSEASREETMQNTYYWAWRNQMNFSYKPTKRQSINLMLGHEMTERESNRLYGKRLNGEDGKERVPFFLRSSELFTDGALFADCHSPL